MRSTSGWLESNPGVAAPWSKYSSALFNFRRASWPATGRSTRPFPRRSPRRAATRFREVNLWKNPETFAEDELRYQFLVDTYETEIEKVLGVWAMFEDVDFKKRPHPADKRGRHFHEHLVHQSLSENLWFERMLGIRVSDNPVPREETRLGFMKAYAENAGKRLEALRRKDEAWFEDVVDFFEVKRSRAWILTRRIAHTSHHRGQQTALLRMLGRSLHSTYGPTADTGGLMQNQAPVVYAYFDVPTLLAEEEGQRRKRPLPGTGGNPTTERP